MLWIAPGKPYICYNPEGPEDRTTYAVAREIARYLLSPYPDMG